MARRKAAQPQQFSWEEIEGAVGASDADSGGGGGSGVPDAELGMRVGDRVTKGNVEADKKKLFPERFAKRPGTTAKGSASGKGKPSTTKSAKGGAGKRAK